MTHTDPRHALGVDDESTMPTHDLVDRLHHPDLGQQDDHPSEPTGSASPRESALGSGAEAHADESVGLYIESHEDFMARINAAIAATEDEEPPTSGDTNPAGDDTSPASDTEEKGEATLSSVFPTPTRSDEPSSEVVSPVADPSQPGTPGLLASKPMSEPTRQPKRGHRLLLGLVVGVIAGVTVALAGLGVAGVHWWNQILLPDSATRYVSADIVQAPDGVSCDEADMTTTSEWPVWRHIEYYTDDSGRWVAGWDNRFSSADVPTGCLAVANQITTELAQ